jgi:hypothetical protein
MNLREAQIAALRSDPKAISRLLDERNRLSLERGDLLTCLFQPYETRAHLAAILLGDNDSLKEPLPRQTGQSQSG